MSSLASLHHTWLGGLLVHLIMVGSWVWGWVPPVLLVFLTADHTRGFSALIFAIIFCPSKRGRRAIAATVVAICVCMGPWNPASASFKRYWVSAGCMAFMCIMTWFWTLTPRPGFKQFMQDLDFKKYFAACELRGALDEIRKEGSIFGFHPHGVVCIGSAWNAGWSKEFEDVAGTTHFLGERRLVEDNPLFKAIADLHGAIGTLNKENLLEHLGRRDNIGMTPGGFEDATALEFGAQRTVTFQRSAFIKYALQHGYRVHPVYTFGETETYHTPYTGALGFRFWLNSKKFPAPIFWGLSWAPFLPLTKARILTYVGKAIQLPKVEDPSLEEVERWHGVYIAALIQVFADNKVEAGLPKSAKLEIW